MIGQQLAHYEILSALGEGGMGKVWRAHDTKLGRDVAIKTLPEEFAADADRLARFEREARFLATLDHPNIAGIHGLEESAGTRFLVLELVEGDTVAERLEQGPLPVEDALKLGLQIAEALEAAHAKGVIHRDLKPANIKATQDSRVKVLDFGLAKAFSVDAPEAANDSRLSNSPLHSLSATARGVLLGTAPYMAPEQARGEPVDLRSDIWAFGCVLFEMLTGQRPFDGRTVSDILASILKTEPDWSLLPLGVHPRVRYLLERCLEKDPRLRAARIAEIRADIQKTLSTPGDLGPQPTVARQAGLGLRLGWIAAIVVAAAGSALATGWLRPADPLPSMHFGFAPENATHNQAPPVSVLAYSPDGRRVAYSSLDRLWIREIDQIEPVPLGGPTGWIALPTFDPTGQVLAYVQGRTSAGPYSIMRVPVGGGTPAPVSGALAAMPTDLSWDESGMLLYVQPDGIWEVSAAGGGNPRRIVQAGEDEELASPQRLPDGGSVLFAATPVAGAGGWDSGGIYVSQSASTERTLVLEGASDPRYVSGGYLLFAEASALWAVGFDPGSGAVNGNPFRALDSDVLRSADGVSDTAHYAVSENGSLAYLGTPPEMTLFNTLADGPDPFAALGASVGSLVWFDPDTGNADAIDVPAAEYSVVRISPDGNKAVLVIGSLVGGSQDLWVLDLETEDRSRLTGDGLSSAPVWLGNDRIIFRRGPAPYGMYSISADGGAAELVLATRNPQMTDYPWDVTPDRSALLFMEGGAVPTIYSHQDLLMFPLDQDGELMPLLTGELMENGAAFSPNGDYLVYQESREVGSFGDHIIKIRPFPDVSLRDYEVGPGITPVFTRAGSELLYVDGDDIAVVPIEYEPFDIGTRAPLGLQGQYVLNSAGRAWDVAPDGRLLMTVLGSPTGVTELQVNVIVGFDELLQERAN